MLFSFRAPEAMVSAMVSALVLSPALAVAAPAQARISEPPPLCASDGQAPPVAILERFIHADCESCWTAMPAVPGRGAVAVDWVVPSARGDDAPLSAVALREAQWRLDALGQPVILDTLTRRSRVTHAGPAAPTTPTPGRPRLRVGHGLVLNGYVGASIELRGAPRQAGLRAWLVLVEQLPAGTEGSPVARQLVRNVLQLDWDGRARGATRSLKERRPLSIPPGTQAGRIAVLGWVEDAAGSVIAASASRCRG